ncbi:pilus assembly protein TadG-related protein [Streptomyces sp. NPDC059575]|uniref:pilus assembly protein TadG-related protein n=1 Tax=Streptomyces sp. NPDC059575 TaxID=3346872 RepID=UPI0036937AAD
MTRRRCLGEQGQAFPIYITVVAGLLFLALAYLAVGQASVNRSGAQTAADAAALAAAQNARKQLTDAWLQDLADPAKWGDIFEGKGVQDPCWRAGQLAAQNDADLTLCDPGLLRYTVEVKTNKPVGDSVVPGTENIRSTESATAVIEPLCTFDPPDHESEPPDPETGDPEPGGDELPELTCGEKAWPLHADDDTGLPGPDDLFDVHLAE